jgi:glycosyltransferase involved in cell wall biosynthesis
MRIVHVITGLSTGGAEIMLYNLLSRTNRDRFTPIVVSLMAQGTLSDRILDLDISVHSLGMKPGALPTPNIFWNLIRILRQLQPNIIQGWMYHGNLAAYVASRFFVPKIPVIWGIHHSIAALDAEKQMTQAIIKLSARISDSPKKIVFVSQTSRLQHEALGYSSQNSCVIPNGFDLARFQPSSQAKINIRTALGLTTDSLLVGLFCRYHPMKDHANFLQAAAILIKKYPNVHFLLAGTDVDTANQNLQQLINDLALSQVYLLGERSDIPNLMAALDIATSASAYGEAFPLVVGEAMSCGVPCAVTDVGDSRWIVSNTGKVVPPKNPQALAQAWQELIEIGSAGRTALGKAARVRIQENFALDAVVAQYQALYV